MAKRRFKVGPLVRTEAHTYYGGKPSDGTDLVDNDRGKAVSLVGPSKVALGAADGEILGFLSSVETGTRDGEVIVGVKEQDYALVDTGTLAVGTLVVIDSNPARGTEGLTKVKAAAAGTTPNFRWVVADEGVIKRI